MPEEHTRQVSIERMLGFIREKYKTGRRQGLLKHAQEIRDMNVSDALEYRMIEHIAITMIIMKLAEVVGIDTIQDILNSLLEEMDKAVQ